MTSFLPDLNVWIALSVADHSHGAAAWKWLGLLPGNARLIFCRYTHIGLLRLLTTEAAMGRQTLSLRQAWAVYDGWLADPRVEFHPESRGLDATVRKVMTPFAARSAPKAIGDCYLLAYAHECGAALASYDKPLVQFARRHGYSVVIPN